MFSTRFFTKMGIKVRNELREHIFDNAKDVDDKSFPTRYSEPYGSKKRAGLLRGQDAASRSSTAPFVTGNLKNDTMFRNPTKRSVEVGWAKSGGKIKALSKMSRVLTKPSQPIPKRIIKMLTQMVRKESKRIVKVKYPDGKVIRLPIGKK